MRYVSRKKQVPLFFILCGFLWNASYASNLLSVYQDGLSDSPLLKQYQASNLASAESVPIAAGAILPQLNLTGQVAAANLSGPGFSGNYTFDTYGLTLSQTIFNYSGFSNLAVAYDTKKVAQANYQAQLQSFILMLAEDYFSVLLARDTLSFSQAQVLSLKATLDQVHQRFSVGLSTHADVLQSQANYDSACAEVVQNKNTLDSANQALFALTGKNEENLAALSPSFPFLPPAPNRVSAWVKQALGQNTALVAQEATEKAALAGVNAAVGNELPVLSVQAGYNVTDYRHNVPAAISAYSHIVDKTVGLNLTWTLFAGGELVSQSLQAANQYSASQDVTLNLRRQTENNTRQDFSSVLAGLAEVEAYRLAVVSAAETLKIDQAKLKAGTATLVDVLNATQMLYQAQVNWANAKYQYINAYLQLEYDAGLLSRGALVYLNQYLQV